MAMSKALGFATLTPAYVGTAPMARCYRRAPSEIRNSGSNMRRYIRANEPGATYFFTLNLAIRGSNSLLVDHIDTLRSTIRAVRHRRPFAIPAMVVMPDHLHALWTLPPDDADFSTRWALIKAGFSRALASGEQVSPSRAGKGERGIWQRRFWEHQIRDDTDFARHVDYIHYNPVKHGFVERAVMWPHSSFHRFVRAGMLALDWAAAPDLRNVDWE